MSSRGPARRADLLVHARSILAVRVPPVVWFLGLTSFLTDISSEMLVSSLPGFLVLHLGATPLVYGIIDGLYHGLTSVARLISGAVADRTRRYKETAFVGYAISALCKMLLVVAPGPAAIGAIVAADRLGKGIRTAPRDALVGLSVDRSALGQAFGVHRALDTAGAALGPVFAFIVLVAAVQAYDAVFVVSFAFAVAGLAALGLFVRNPQRGALERAPSSGVGFRALFAIREYRTLLAIATALSLATVSDGFLYLVIQREVGANAAVLPLLFAGTAFGFFALAIPFGWAADRFGRRTVFVGGYGLLLAAYAVVLLPLPGAVKIAVLLLALGGYYAATDGVLAALVSAILPRDVRTSGLAAIATCVTIARLVSSIAFGYLWTIAPAGRAVQAFGVALTFAIAYAVARFRTVAAEAP